MITLIENAEVYAPEPSGRQSVLVIDETIQKVGDIEAHALERLGLPFEVVDASECVLTPGFVDGHQHLLGGSGEEGFSSQTPEIHASEIISAGVTTVVGCLGVDTTMKTMAGLLGCAKGLKEEGLSAYIWSGGYNVPPTTITSCIRDDIMFIEEVIGAGEVAISDERSTDPTAQELARLTNDAYIGGMLSRKAGVTQFHAGDKETRLKLLQELISDFHVPPGTLYPTHVERSKRLLKEAIELTGHGCYVDMDSAGEDLAKWICFYFDHDGDPNRLTLSSDAGKTSPSNTLDQIRKCAEQGCVDLPRLLPLVTSNPAKVLKLEHKGVVESGKTADLLILREGTLELRDVMVGGQFLFRDGKLNFQEPCMTESNRVISLTGTKAAHAEEENHAGETNNS